MCLCFLFWIHATRYVVCQVSITVVRDVCHYSIVFIVNQSDVDLTCMLIGDVDVNHGHVLNIIMVNFQQFIGGHWTIGLNRTEVINRILR